MSEPTTPVPVFPPRGEPQQDNTDFPRLEALIDVDHVKSDYLFGIPLTSSLTGQTLGDGTIQRQITRSISHLEHILNIPISPVDYTERFDYSHRDFQNFCFIRLNHWPVTQIKSIKAKYPASSDFVEYSNSWVSCYNETGIFQLVPATGPQAQIIYSGQSLFLPFILGSKIKWPQLWEVTYTAGFAAGAIPAIINHLIGTHVAMQCLSLLGPVLYPVNSYAVGIDGVSQSVGNAGPQFFQSRMQELQQDYQMSLDAVKRRYAQKILLEALGD